jgi:hypothetical protein
MSTLKFSAEAVRKLVAHSKGRKHKDTIYGEPLPKDMTEVLRPRRGHLLDERADEKLPDDPTKPEGKSFVVYADRCAPDSPDSWDRCRALVGGDDFAEPLPLRMFEQAMQQPNIKWIVMRVSLKSISVGAA